MPLLARKSAGILLLAGLLGTIIFYRLGALPLIDPDEPRYAQSAREMIERGSILVPYFNGAPRLNKPVLFYWLICSSYMMAGVSEFSARLPSALAALGILLAAFFFVARLHGFLTAAVSCVILGCLPLFFISARLVMPDMILSFWIVLSLCCFYNGWQAGQVSEKRNWYIGFYLFQAAGAWTKGPVGMFLPLAVAGLSMLRARDRQELKLLRLQWALPLVLAASLAWFLYVLLAVDRQQMESLAFHETIGRFFGLEGESHDPAHYYVRILSAGLFPSVLLLPWACYQRLKTVQPGRLLTFLETWMLFMLLFFSACFAKKPQYILPLAFPFAVWLGVVCREAIARQRHPDRVLLGTLALLPAGLSFGLYTGMGWIAAEAPAMLSAGIAAGSITLAVLVLALLSAVRRRSLLSVVLVSIISVPFAVAFLECGTEWFGSDRSLKDFIMQNRNLLSQVKTIHYQYKNYSSLIFYADRPVERIDDLSNVAARLREPEPLVCFLNRRAFIKKQSELTPFLAAIHGNKIIVSNVARLSGRPAP
jgi:4-amino-4-deoxy-L-arabinose transferase-like glycosyltransferase